MGPASARGMRKRRLPGTRPARASRLVLLVQAGYYLVGGLVPIVLPRAWERLTGPKADWWLVNTVGWLTAVIGATLGAQALEHRRGVGTGVLQRGVALAFIGVDAYYVARGRISRVYLVDAAWQTLLLAASLGWLRVGSPRTCGGHGIAGTTARHGGTGRVWFGSWGR